MYRALYECGGQKNKKEARKTFTGLRQGQSGRNLFIEKQEIRKNPGRLTDRHLRWESGKERE